MSLNAFLQASEVELGSSHHATAGRGAPLVLGVVWVLDDGLVADALRAAVAPRQQLPRDRVVPRLEVLHRPRRAAGKLADSRSPLNCLIG